MISEPTGRELELHNYLLAHGAKQVSNVAHVFSMQAVEEYLPDAMIVSTEFWSEERQEHFCFDTFLSRSLIDDPDAPIEVLANIVLRGAVDIDEAGPPL